MRVRLYCGNHTKVSLVSDGDQGECGWEAEIEVGDQEWADGTVAAICGSCGAWLDPVYDMTVVAA